MNFLDKFHLPFDSRHCNPYYMARDNEQPITDALRKAIAESGVSFIGLERETGVLRQSLMKFARGEQVLRGDAYDRLAAYFGMVLTVKRRRKR